MKNLIATFSLLLSGVSTAHASVINYSINSAQPVIVAYGANAN